MSIRDALRFTEGAGVPRDLGSTTVSAVAAPAYRRAADARGISDAHIALDEFDVIQQIVQPSAAMRREIGVSTVRFGVPRLVGPDCEYPDLGSNHQRCRDQFGCEWVFERGRDHYFNMTSSPMAHFDSIEEGLSRLDFPTIHSSAAAITAALAANLRIAASLRDEQTVVVADRNIAGLTEVAFRIRGYEEFFIDLISDPVGAGQLLDRILEYKIGYWNIVKRFLVEQESEGLIDIVVECDDLGTQDSLLCSPDTMKEVIFPRQKTLFAELKKLFPQSRLMFHSDGAIRPILPMLIESGVDILNPVQFTARGMELAELKRQFGNDLIFWGGGIDTQHTLSFGTPDDVRDEAKRAIETLAPGGGFVFAAVHNIQSEVPPENFWALWETVQSYD